MTKIYVTKYALSSGIGVTEARIDSDGYAKVHQTYGWLLNPRGYALTSEDAIKQAEVLRQKKLASLKKQIAKLEKLSFEVPDA